MASAVKFWQSLLRLEPIKQSAHWSEFKIGEVRLGFLLNDFEEQISGNSSVPVIELELSDLPAFVERAKGSMPFSVERNDLISRWPERTDGRADA